MSETKVGYIGQNHIHMISCDGKPNTTDIILFLINTIVAFTWYHLIFLTKSVLSLTGSRLSICQYYALKEGGGGGVWQGGMILTVLKMMCQNHHSKAIRFGRKPHTVAGRYSVIKFPTFVLNCIKNPYTGQCCSQNRHPLVNKACQNIHPCPTSPRQNADRCIISHIKLLFN